VAVERRRGPAADPSQTVTPVVERQPSAAQRFRGGQAWNLIRQPDQLTLRALWRRGRRGGGRPPSVAALRSAVGIGDPACIGVDRWEVGLSEERAWGGLVGLEPAGAGCVGRPHSRLQWQYSPCADSPAPQYRQRAVQALSAPQHVRSLAV